MWCKKELEKVSALLFRCLGNGTQLALCSVSWMNASICFVLVIDTNVFEPVGVAKPCDVLKTHPSLTVVPHGAVGGVKDDALWRRCTGSGGWSRAKEGSDVNCVSYSNAPHMPSPTGGKSSSRWQA